MPEVRRVDKLDDRHYADGERVEATEQREFSVAGKHYISFLTDQHAKEFDEDFDRWASVATPVDRRATPAARSTAPRSTTSSSPKAAEKQENRDIRAWAESQHMKISDRGRIPGDVKRAYFAAHPNLVPVGPLD
jgi:CHAD domain-containing protein